MLFGNTDDISTSFHATLVGAGSFFQCVWQPAAHQIHRQVVHRAALLLCRTLRRDRGYRPEGIQRWEARPVARI